MLCKWVICLQYLSINLPTKNSTGTSLTELTNLVSSRDIDSVLNLNNIARSHDIGKSLLDFYETLDIDSYDDVTYQEKGSILNTLTGDSDVFETAALLNETEWKFLKLTGSFYGMLKIPETIKLSSVVGVLGNNEHVKKDIYNKSFMMLNDEKTYNHKIDPSIFNNYDGKRGSQILTSTPTNNPMQWFKLPWGKISLYSSLSGKSMDFPVYPDGLKDGVQANYETMSDILYQYEPWQVYHSSGPRSNTFSFKMHRDMWSGNHLDGKCNELIRFCEANCYPDYKGASVQTSTVTLYLVGKPYITGVMTSVDVSWDSDSPIGQDGFYLVCQLDLTITEVASEPLSYNTVMNKGLIS